MAVRVDGLVEFLHDTAGENLRSVASYDAEGYEIEYLRDDIAEQYTPEEVDRVFEDVRLEGLGSEFTEGLYVHGDLECVVRCFEDAVEMHFTLDDRRGVAVALDAEALVANQTFLGACLDRVDSIEGAASERGESARADGG